MSAASRSVAWVKDDPFGVEFAEIGLAGDRLTATGVAIGTAPVPYRLDYEVETAPGFATARLHVLSRGDGWRRTLELGRDAAGAWSIAATHEGEVDLPAPGADPEALAEAVDFDLGLCPVTNMIPLRRHDLLARREPLELTLAWVSVPDLAVQLDGQRYTVVHADAERPVVGFEATDGTFSSEITFDREGIVVDYPGIARQLHAT